MTETEHLPTLAAAFLRIADEVPDREAVVFNDLRWSYAELRDRALARAASLHALGLPRGAHIGIMLGNCPEFLELYLGAVLAGMVAVCVPTRYRARELVYVVENSDAIALFALGDASRFDSSALLHEAFPALDEPGPVALAQAPRLRHVFVTGTAHGAVQSYDSFAALAKPDGVQAVRDGIATLSGEADQLMLYTSGTTSFPKGCPLKDSNVVRKGYAMHPRYRMGDGARVWDALPFYHISFTAMWAATILARGTLVTASDTNPGTALDMLERERVDTAFPVFATVLMPILNHPDYRPERLRHLRTMLIVDPTDDIARAERALPDLRITASFGMSETAAFACQADWREDQAHRLQTVGRPYPGIEVRLWDVAHGGEVKPGEIGEIQLRGASVFQGYYKDPEKTAEVFMQGGWFRTGDLGSHDTTGRLVYRGRLKDMLKVGGENVATVEIEMLLCMHPAVAIAQVVGVPDARLKEVPAAFVELHPGAQATPSEIVHWCRGRIASFKLPRYVRILQQGEWPMSATKIQKTELRAMDPGERLLA